MDPILNPSRLLPGQVWLCRSQQHRYRIVDTTIDAEGVHPHTRRMLPSGCWSDHVSELMPYRWIATANYWHSRCGSDWDLTQCLYDPALHVETQLL